MTERARSPSFRVLACPADGDDSATVVVLVVAGALDGADDALADRVEAMLGGCRGVVVDVHRLDRADVGAVAALARLQLRLRTRGISLRLRGARNDLRSVLSLLGLERVLRVEDDG